MELRHNVRLLQALSTVVKASYSVYMHLWTFNRAVGTFLPSVMQVGMDQGRVCTIVSTRIWYRPDFGIDQALV
jgi:hypothetical protein